MTLATGEFAVQAHERIVFGRHAAEVVLAEAQRYGARRIFIVTNRSLARLGNGPLPRLVRALGSLHAGTFAAMASFAARGRTRRTRPCRVAAGRRPCATAPSS